MNFELGQYVIVNNFYHTNKKAIVIANGQNGIK